MITGVSKIMLLFITRRRKHNRAKRKPLREQPAANSTHKLLAEHFT